MSFAKRPAVPLTLEQASLSPEWLNEPWWPLSQQKLRKHCVRPLRNISRISKDADKELLPIINLISPAVAHWGGALIEASLMCQKGNFSGTTVLHQGLFDKEKQNYFLSSIAPKENKRMGFLETQVRQLLRTSSWSNIDTLIPNLIFPKITAFAHNPLVVEMAGGSEFSVGFQHGDTFLNSALKQGKLQSFQRAKAVTELLLDEMEETEEFSDELASKHKLFFREIIYLFAKRAENDLAALSNVRLPEKIWTGTFLKWSSRALGLATMLNGGSAVSFDHGGGVGNVADSDFFQSEISGGASFVACSPMAASMIRNTLLDIHHSPNQIFAGSGDPTFKKIKNRQRIRRKSDQKVVYATTVFRGNRQYAPALLPDPVYLIWQRQVLSALKKMPGEVIFKPAPEGFLKAQAHPLAVDFNTSYEPFEIYLDDADIFVFDYVHSTTFWKALCSERPVILFDLGVNALNPFIKNELEKNIKIIEVIFGNDGIPKINREQFFEALAVMEPRDPSFFRELICAEESGSRWPSW